MDNNIKQEGFPLPNPKVYDNEDNFMSACISEASKEFPQKTAIAICLDLWRKRNR